MYEVYSNQTPIHGVKLRGTVRKRANDNWINLLIENARDIEDRQCVRFCVLSENDYSKIYEYIQTLVPDVEITLVIDQISNPIPSSLKHNIDSRYD